MTVEEPDASPLDLWELFAAASALAPEDREPFLQQACDGQPELLRELEEMLASSGDEAALEIESRLLARDEEVLPSGSRAGPYRLLGLLARGGMGEVYLGERVDGSYDQVVAVKVLRPGLQATEMVDRFRQERDVLARLTHPAVVPLLDGGTTGDGRPFLVLQYVPGQPITTHCRERELGTRQRICLFFELCRAVQYAHSNLIVHRDLKPSNVLVDTEGRPRLLDFGIAK
ncbi:MAG: serine/threonine protein kinase, partial [Acidobacteria bacterium]|nr:serine/threonine protein kinase [Acidobacteriota bacterium]